MAAISDAVAAAIDQLTRLRLTIWKVLTSCGLSQCMTAQARRSAAITTKIAIDRKTVAIAFGTQAG